MTTMNEDQLARVRNFLSVAIKRHGGAQLARKVGISRSRLYQLRDSGLITEDRCRKFRDVLTMLELSEPKGRRMRPLLLREMRPDVWVTLDEKEEQLLKAFEEEPHEPTEHLRAAVA